MTSPARALVLLGDRAVLSHESAARELGIELLQDDGAQRLTVPRSWSRPRLDGWHVVRADLTVHQVELGAALRVTAPARTVGDLARVLPLPTAVAAADSAMRLGLTTLAQLRARLTSARGPGAPALRAVAGQLDPLSGSVAESAARVELHLGGLPRPVSQYEVRNEHGRLVARVDLAWPGQRLVVEVGGFAFHSDRLAYRRDREKMNELERLGWRVLRVTWEDVVLRQAAFVELVAECLPGARAA